MTVDEIKGLNMDDNVYMKGKVIFVRKDGRECLVATRGADGDEWRVYARAEDLSRALLGEAVGTVKHEACRRLRKGDRVQLAAPLRRKIARLEEGVIYEVKQDESDFGTVEVWTYEHENYELYPYCIFEIVTPVEEPEPYTVRESDSFFYLEKEGETTALAVYHKKLYPNAKASAEYERDRLNTEWREKVGTKVPRSEDRKEHEND